MTTSTDVRRIVMVSSGLSEESATNRLGEALLASAQRQAEAQGLSLEVTRVFLREMASQIASAGLSGFATGELRDAYAALSNADGLIALTPTFKASYTGLFKGFWDVSEDGHVADVPTVLGATGGSERHSLMTDTAMRPLFAYLGARVLPTAIYAATSDWASTELNRRIDRAAAELVMALAGKASVSDASATPRAGAPTSELARRRERVAHPFEGVPTMEQMLKG